MSGSKFIAASGNNLSYHLTAKLPMMPMNLQVFGGKIKIDDGDEI